MSGMGAPALDNDSLPKNKELGDRFFGILGESLKPGSFTEEGGLYTLTLKTADLVNMIKALAGDIDANTGVYADALLELEANFPGYLDSIGLQAANRDELIATIKTEVAELSSNIADTFEDIPDFTARVSLGSGKDGKSFDVRMSLTAPEEKLDIKADIVLSDVEIEKITPPTDSLTLEDILSLFIM